MSMELDDMKQAITNLDRNVAHVQRLSATAFKERTLDRTRASLRPVLWEHAGQVALGAITALVVGPFWWSHRAEPALLVAGLLLHVYAVLMIVLGARVIVAVRTLDLEASVVETQKALARLRRSYVMTGFIVGMPWWFLWIPLLMVVFGVDLVASASRPWLFANLIVAVAGIAGTLWWYRHLWVGPVDSERRRRIEESASGKSFVAARRFLDEIAQFERD
jgi:hypothetical protein